MIPESLRLQLHQIEDAFIRHDPKFNHQDGKFAKEKNQALTCCPGGYNLQSQEGIHALVLRREGNTGGASDRRSIPKRGDNRTCGKRYAGMERIADSLDAVR